MENNKRRLVTAEEKDRISNVPPDLIDSILERIPVEDVVRTSILSKRWRYKWTTMRALVFDVQFLKKLSKYGTFGRHGFVRVINQVLLLHNGPISKFHLYIPNIYLDSFQEVDQWMLLLSRKDVKEIVICNSNRRYQLPSCVFSFLELRRLGLRNCSFKPPFQFERFRDLEVLSLEDIDFGSNLDLRVINLPQLKMLRMYKCTNVNNFPINATNLQVLTVIDCPDAKFRQLLHSQCLATVNLAFGKPINYFGQVEKINLALMLSNKPRVQRFSIDGLFLKCLVAEKPKWFPHLISSLKYLELHHFALGDMDQLQGALCLIRNSPNLETLSIVHVHMEPQYLNDGAGLTSNNFESPECFEQTMNMLQTVELSPIQGSIPQLLLVKLLLAHSPSLQTFTIRPHRVLNVFKILSIAKDVMKFPRASRKAKVDFLDPLP